jgi:hypothetical protein
MHYKSSKYFHIVKVKIMNDGFCIWRATKIPTEESMTVWALKVRTLDDTAEILNVMDAIMIFSFCLGASMWTISQEYSDEHSGGGA